VVDTAGPFDNFCEPVANRRVGRDVELDQLDADASLFRCVEQLCGSGDRANRAEHVVTGLGQVQGCRPADARVRTGHD
jgi:hypothetical protein